MSRLPFLLAAVLLPGCAALPPSARLAPDAQVSIELRDTPFFPQRRYQCGPAALATVLAASGIETTADELVDKVYIPAREGSLQIEMIAATRAAGRLPYPLDPSLSAIAAELAAGRPVLVLQNLGVGWLPRWHYAVIVGIDSNTGTVILRSGTERRRQTPFDVFLRTWQRSDFWALVALTPGTLPANADHDRYVSAVADFEAVGRLDDARLAWLPALQRWPDSPVPAFGLGNIDLAAGKPESAEGWYREALRRDAGHLMAVNNMAYALAAQGRIAEAVAGLEDALGRSAAEPAEAAVLRDSLAELSARLPQRQ